jgi:hypothetical protein
LIRRAAAATVETAAQRSASPLMNLFRTGWDLLHWNFRKAWFRFRGATGRAPCQHPSDSGRAFETGCVACAAWKNPTRFKKICPLLVDTPHGLKCSVDAKNVRPFWRPVVAFYAKAVIGVYLAALLTAFASLRVIGYRISLTDLAGPHPRSKIAIARSELLATKARSAFAAGNFREALILLQNAREANPRNYTLNLDFAVFSGAILPASANAQFAHLMVEHSENSSETALRWLDTLVAHADFKNVFGLAAIQLRTDPSHGNTWARALFFSARQLGAIAELKSLAANPHPNLEPWRDSLRLEIALEEKNSAQTATLLRLPWPPRQPAYAIFHRLDAVAQSAGGFAGLDELQQHGEALDAASRVILVLDILGKLKLEEKLANQVDLLLARQKNAAVIKMLCAQVIRHRDGATFARAQAAATTIDPANADASLWFSLLAAAGAAQDAEAIRAIATRLRAAPGTRALAVAVQHFFEGRSEQASFTAFLPGLGLPLEENYALLENPPRPLQRLQSSR